MAGKAQYSKLEYVAAKPAFLSNFGAGAAPSDRPGRSDRSRDRDGDLPSRPKDGKWARGSDDEADGSDGDKDEWDEMFGGGEGPQVVVLKEGKHLSAEEAEAERRRAAGLPAMSDKELADQIMGRTGADKEETDGKEKEKKDRVRPTPAGHKRKLVGEAVATSDKGTDKKKKKKKAAKGLLSFDEAEGE